MSLIGVILVMALIGFLVWAITTYIPMPDAVKTAIIVVTVIVMVLWICQLLGLFHSADTVTLPEL